MSSIDNLTILKIRADNHLMSSDRISVRELQELLAAGQPVTVVDIQSPRDREWSISGNLQFDAYDAVKSGRLGPLADRDFPPGPVVTVCRSQYPSMAAFWRQR
jgi:hypothetical protein